MAGFNFLEVGTALRNTLVTDLSGLVRGVWILSAPNETGPQAGALPYVVGFPENFGVEPETFDGVASDIVWQFHIIDHIANDTSQLAAVVGAMVGNAVPPSAATSGLHRRDVTMGGDNVLSRFEAVPGAGQFGGTLYVESDPDAKGMFLRFQAIYTKG